MDKGKKLIILLLVILLLIIVYFLGRTFISVTGQIFVDSDSYPKEADVYLNGELQGKTPITIKGLKMGQYELAVKKEGYKSVIKIIDLTRKNANQGFHTPLEHLTFVLQVNSYPTEAEVYVDGIKKGVTPVTIEDLLLGQHFVEVKKMNFSTWSQRIAAEKDKTIELYAELHPSTSSIAITSVPDGADVFLNDKKQGVTPFNLDNLNPGTYNLNVSKDGYILYSEQVTIAKGDTIQRDLVLTKADTFISITTIPPGCSVYIDDVLKGTTPYTGANLSPGIYQLRLEYEGYLTFSSEIQVIKGKTQKYNFSLVKLP